MHVSHLLTCPFGSQRYRSRPHFRGHRRFPPFWPLVRYLELDYVLSKNLHFRVRHSNISIVLLQLSPAIGYDSLCRHDVAFIFLRLMLAIAELAEDLYNS